MAYICIAFAFQTSEYINLYMAKVKGTIEVDTLKCKGCDVCVVSCPFGVLALSSQVNVKGYSYCYMAVPDACVGCASCAVVCPDTCITVYRRKSAEL